jgi:Domain of unknown function (DUF4145)
MKWYNAISPIEPKAYTCGYCGKHTGPNTGYFPDGGSTQRIYICTFCSQPSYFDQLGRQFPAEQFGNAVASLPNDVELLYLEARVSTAAGAYTGAALICRKILMHIAVEKGAAKDKSFQFYVQYLADAGYVPPDGKGWVDHIRAKGNEAAHEIVITPKDDAVELLSFLEMLLRFVYEFPARIPKTPVVAAGPPKP